MEEGGIKENGGGVNSSMMYLIYCKDLCKYYNVPPSSTIKKYFKNLQIELPTLRPSAEYESSYILMFFSFPCN
jgi:hypothetical protein